MTDINFKMNNNDLEDGDLRDIIELLFFSYRAFTEKADDILKDYGFGRAHHRVIYFVGRHAGITVNELLVILNITKQSLNRVLKVLITEEYIKQEKGQNDKRQRHLYLTAQGLELERKLTLIQSDYLKSVFKNTENQCFDCFSKVLSNMMTDKDKKIYLHKEKQIDE